MLPRWPVDCTGKGLFGLPRHIHSLLPGGFATSTNSFNLLLALKVTTRLAVQQAREGSPAVSLCPEWEGRLQAFRSRCEAMRGHPHAKTHALAVEFLNDWEAVFAVLSNPFWPLTNNEAERALRHWVILRQISHGTRTPRGSVKASKVRRICRVMSSRVRAKGPKGTFIQVWGLVDLAPLYRIIVKMRIAGHRARSLN